MLESAEDDDFEYILPFVFPYHEILYASKR